MPRLLLVVIHGFLCLLLALPAVAEVSLGPSLRILLEMDATEVPGALRTLQTPGLATTLPRFARTAFPMNGDNLVEVFVQARGLSQDIPGLQEVSTDLYAGRISISTLRRLIDKESISAARLSRPVRFAMDKSMPYLGMERVRKQNPDTRELEGLTGKGVLVGIIDGGLDASHPDLQTADGQTRILRYWDQWWDSPSSPAEYLFGTEYTSVQINDRIESIVDLSGHGTHVVGVAVGNGRGSEEGGPFLGVAPEAQVIGVRTTFTEVGVVLGARYIFDRARSLGMPAVINLSLGNHFGPHVGDSFFESALDELVGPGRLIVAAAGNEGHQDIHAEITLEAGESAELAVQMPAYTKSDDTFAFLDLEGWFDPSNRYRFTVINPQGVEVGALEYRDLKREFVDTRGIARGWYTRDQGWGSLLLELEDNYNSTRLATGEWKIRVEALEVKGDPELDFWIVLWNGFRDNAAPGFTRFIDRQETVISPSTAKHILSVGAISTRSCWPNALGAESCYPEPPVFGDVAFFSSRGPTADGRAKPEVLAPGFGVVSALSSQVPPQALSEEIRIRRTTPDGRYWINQGTSMSAPHVTGTVALLLERYPTMNFEQMRDRLVSRGSGVVDARSGRTVPSLKSAESLKPAVSLALSELTIKAEGVQLRWFVGKERESIRYSVLKGFSPQGPFTEVSSRRITGGNPYTVLDRNLDPGRTHYYRIVARNVFGLTEELDTLSVDIGGVPRPVLRSPAPNPGRTQVSLGYFLPASPGGGEFQVDVFDLQGRHLATLDRGSFGSSGVDGESSWNLSDSAGSRVAAGVYFVSMRYRYQGGASHTQVHRVVVLP